MKGKESDTTMDNDQSHTKLQSLAFPSRKRTRKDDHNGGIKNHEIVTSAATSGGAVSANSSASFPAQKCHHREVAPLELLFSGAVIAESTATRTYPIGTPQRYLNPLLPSIRLLHSSSLLFRNMHSHTVHGSLPSLTYLIHKQLTPFGTRRHSKVTLDDYNAAIDATDAVEETSNK